MAPTDWLMQPVPLYAFLLAGATSPLLWTQYARKLAEKRLGDAPIQENPPGGETATSASSDGQGTQ